MSQPTRSRTVSIPLLTGLLTGYRLHDMTMQDLGNLVMWVCNCGSMFTLELWCVGLPWAGKAVLEHNPDLAKYNVVPEGYKCTELGSVTIVLPEDLKMGVEGNALEREIRGIQQVNPNAQVMVVPVDDGVADE